MRWNSYRTASVILLVYCLLHSYGALIATPDFGGAADSVLKSMRETHFLVQGFEDTWYGFYLGFGWIASLFFVLTAMQLWIIGGRELVDRRRDRPLVVLLAVAYAIALGLCLQFFFPAPLGFSAAALVAIAWALISDAMRVRRIS